MSRIDESIWIDASIINAALSLLVSGATANDVAFVPVETVRNLKVDSNWHHHLQKMGDLTKKKLILFPSNTVINLSESCNEFSHWYLIGYTAKDNLCHFFTSRPIIFVKAMKPIKDFCHQIQQYMQPENITNNSNEFVLCTIEFCRFDCGMLLIMNAKAFIKLYGKWRPNVCTFATHTRKQIESYRIELVAILKGADPPIPIIVDAPEEIVSNDY